MRKLVMLVGCPASGKSTYIKTLFPLLKDAVVMSFDSIIESFAEKDGTDYATAFNAHAQEAGTIYDQCFKEALATDKDIIIDKTNMSKKSRAKTLDLINKSDWMLVAIDFSQVPIGEIKKRLIKREKETGKHIPEEVVDKMIASYEAPTREEGFNYIIYTV